jgi:hypothetical protein
MYEHLTRHEAGKLVCGHAAVGATNPQKLGGLLFGERWEKLWILCFDILGPGSVLIEKTL